MYNKIRREVNSLRLENNEMQQYSRVDNSSSDGIKYKRALTK